MPAEMDEMNRRILQMQIEEVSLKKENDSLSAGRLEALQKELAAYPNVTWDREPDGFAAMGKAEIMISDLSGIINDFAFIFLRPVITLDFEVNYDGFEGFDIPHPQFEFDLLEKLGKRLKIDEVERLPEIIRTLLENREETASRLKSLRDHYVVNFGHAAGPIVDEICHIAEVVARDESNAAHAVSALHSAA